ncbi:MAG: hypothetical protein U1C73_22260, partial [Dietzia sp.]|nr:hypothetical protein [Dietzia sp.]
RCSGDARAALERSTADVSALERVEAALRVESDESLFESMTSAAGHTLQVLKTRWYGLRTYGAHCDGCGHFVTPEGGFTSPADAHKWAQAYTASDCAPDPATLAGIGGGEPSTPMSGAEADEINRDRVAGVHNLRVLPTRYRGLPTWSVYCPGCDTWLSPEGGYGQAGPAVRRRNQGCAAEARQAFGTQLDHSP